MENARPARRIGVVLFQGFELLDVFGPLEMYGLLPDLFRITLVGPQAGGVTSAQGPSAVAESAYEDAPSPDLVLVPGGVGSRELVKDRPFLDWLRAWSARSEFVTSVCTGSGVLAAAGLLDGFRATTNKMVFSFATSQSDRVTWVRQARWVEDRNRWTSSGISAGIDMALALIAHLHGEDVAVNVANEAEYEWHRDASWDPFAHLASGS
jgi:transcriptional regulator GlxA family with amidase domain